MNKKQFEKMNLNPGYSSLRDLGCRSRDQLNIEFSMRKGSIVRLGIWRHIDKCKLAVEKIVYVYVPEVIIFVEHWSHSSKQKYPQFYIPNFEEIKDLTNPELCRPACGEWYYEEHYKFNMDEIKNRRSR